MRTFIYLLLLLVLCTTLDIQAQRKPNSYVHQSAQVHLKYPDGWYIDKHEKMVTLQQLGGEISVSLRTLKTTKIEEALMELESLIRDQISDPEITSDPKIIEINGMQGVVMDMQGYLKGMRVQVGIFLIERPPHVLMLLGMGKKTALQQYEKELNSIINSIKPLN
jgi:predicted Zn-dependent protease